MEPVADGLAQLALNNNDKPETASGAATAAPDASAAKSGAPEAAGAKQGAIGKQPPLQHMDPAVKQALLDSNRPTALKLEEAVLEFLTDSSKPSLEFPPSTSNYERLLQHKVAQHYLLQTSTATVSGTPRVVAKRPDRPLGSKDSSSSSKPQVPKLADVDVSSIKLEPKALIRRPPSANSMRGPDGSGGLTQQQQQQRKKTHKEREAEYHEARERLLGNSLAHGSGSTGNLAAMAAAGSNAGSRPGSAGANKQTATMGAEFLAAVPPKSGERGFNLVNPGRGAGRGSPNPGRGAGGRGAGGNEAADASAAAGEAAAGGQQEQQQQQVGGANTPQQQQQQPQKQKQPQQQQQQRCQQQQQQVAGGRGPKAVYRDRQRDEQDPDYARGVDRFQARFDPGFGGAGGQQAGNMYNMPTYGSEFPSLGAPNGAAAAGGSRHHGRSGSMGAGSGTAANGAQQGTAFHKAGSTGNIPQGGQQQQQQGASSKAQQRHQQYQAAQQQQQQMAAAAGGAQWGYYPPGPADPAAAAAMYNQMAAAGAAWGYGMAGPMDPSMAAAAAAGYAYGAYTPWGWGAVPPGGVMPAYPAAGQAGYGPPMMPPQYGQQQQQQYGAQHGGTGGAGGRGGGRGGGGGKAGGSSK